MVLVVGLAQVESEIELTIDEHMGRLSLLAIEVEAAAQNDLMNGGVLDAGVAVVAAVAHRQGLGLGVGFAFEERIGQEILAQIVLAALETERRIGRIEVAAPAAHDLEIALLRESHEERASVVLWHEVFEVDRTLPTAVFVRSITHAIARDAVGPDGVSAYSVVEEVLVVGDY